MAITEFFKKKYEEEKGKYLEGRAKNKEIEAASREEYYKTKKEQEIELAREKAKLEKEYKVAQFKTKLQRRSQPFGTSTIGFGGLSKSFGFGSSPIQRAVVTKTKRYKGKKRRVKVKQTLQPKQSNPFTNFNNIRFI